MATKADDSSSSSNDDPCDGKENIGLSGLDLNELLIELRNHAAWLKTKVDQVKRDEISADILDMFTDSGEEDNETAAEPACDDCDLENEDYFSTHGLLVNGKVPRGEHPEDRAKLTLPEGFSLSQSSIPEIALGVWTKRDLPKGIVLGPYEGEKVYDFKKARQSGYAWLITKNGKPHHYVDAQDPSKSNWLRYINYATDERFQNLIAFQYKGDIYYRTYKPVEKYTELLVWYGDEYAQETGVDLMEDDVDEEAEKKFTPFSCKKCGLSFSAEKYLNFHFKRHRDESVIHRHKCNFCSYSTEIAANLRRHLLTHTGERPHVCTLCGKGFAQLDSLQTHMLIHSDEKSYQCEVCRKKFSQKRNLTLHQKTHSKETPYACNICGKGFIHSSSLRMHQLRHGINKPHKCPHCEYRSIKSCYLRRHVISCHTKQYPHCCPTCGKGFHFPSQVQRHMLKKHLMTEK